MKERYKFAGKSLHLIPFEKENKGLVKDKLSTSITMSKGVIPEQSFSKFLILRNSFLCITAAPTMMQLVHTVSKNSNNVTSVLTPRAVMPSDRLLHM